MYPTKNNVNAPVANPPRKIKNFFISALALKSSLDYIIWGCIPKVRTRYNIVFALQGSYFLGRYTKRAYGQALGCRNSLIVEKMFFLFVLSSNKCNFVKMRN